MKKLFLLLIVGILSFNCFTSETPGVSFVARSSGGGGDSLPPQTGNTGYLLTTDGSAASWINPLLVSFSASNLSTGTIPDARFPATLPAVSGANLTALNGTNIASGTVADARLSGNVTLLGNTFNGASQLVQLTAAGKYPAVDGSLMTTLNATQLTSGTIPDARFPGGAFNGASELVQLTAATKYPALDGSLITAVNATNIGITNDTSTNATVYPTWVTTTTGNLPAKISSTKFTFNPSTGTITATAFSGDGSALTSLAAGNLTGTVATARLGSGTANSTTYLRGDQTWAAAPTPTSLADTDIGISRSTANIWDITNTNGSQALQITAGAVVRGKAVTSPTFSSGSVTSNVVTINTTAAHNLATGQIVRISGSTGVTVNGYFPITRTSATAFTFPYTVGNGTVTAATITPKAIAFIGDWPYTSGSTNSSYFGSTTVANLGTIQCGDGTLWIDNPSGGGDSSLIFRDTGNNLARWTFAASTGNFKATNYLGTQVFDLGVWNTANTRYFRLAQNGQFGFDSSAFDSNGSLKVNLAGEPDVTDTVGVIGKFWIGSWGCNASQAGANGVMVTSDGKMGYKTGTGTTIDNVAVTSNVATIFTHSNSNNQAGDGFRVGQYVTIAGLANTALNGTWKITEAVQQNKYKFAVVTANIAATADSGTIVAVDDPWQITDGTETGIKYYLGGARAIAASATALILYPGSVQHVSGTTTITSISTTDANGSTLKKGIEIVLIFDGSLTFTDGNNLKLAGNFSTAADSTIKLVFDGTNFYEVCRSTN